MNINTDVTRKLSKEEVEKLLTEMPENYSKLVKHTKSSVQSIQSLADNVCQAALETFSKAKLWKANPVQGTPYNELDVAHFFVDLRYFLRDNFNVDSADMLNQINGLMVDGLFTIDNLDVQENHISRVLQMTTFAYWRNKADAAIQFLHNVRNGMMVSQTERSIKITENVNRSFISIEKILFGNGSGNSLFELFFVREHYCFTPEKKMAEKHKLDEPVGLFQDGAALRIQEKEFAALPPMQQSYVLDLFKEMIRSADSLLRDSPPRSTEGADEHYALRPNTVNSLFSVKDKPISVDSGTWNHESLIEELQLIHLPIKRYIEAFGETYNQNDPKKIEEAKKLFRCMWRAENHLYAIFSNKPNNEVFTAFLTDHECSHHRLFDSYKDLLDSFVKALDFLSTNKPTTKKVYDDRKIHIASIASCFAGLPIIQTESDKLVEEDRTINALMELANSVFLPIQSKLDLFITQLSTTNVFDQKFETVREFYECLWKVTTHLAFTVNESTIVLNHHPLCQENAVSTLLWSSGIFNSEAAKLINDIAIRGGDVGNGNLPTAVWTRYKNGLEYIESNFYQGSLTSG